MEEKLLTIAEAAEILGVSLDTLRRYDKNGKLVAIRKEGGVHRYYRQSDLDLFKSDLIKIATDWTREESELPSMFYCENSAVFQTRLVKMQNVMIESGLSANILPLIIAVAGEIGNNSFDHNLGKWPDSPGVFFGFDILKKIRETEATKNIPVIVFSNLSEDKDIKKANELGATDFMVKSNFTLDELTERIGKALTK